MLLKFLDFPWPFPWYFLVFHFRSIVKTIYYLRYFNYHIMITKCASVYFVFTKISWFSELSVVCLFVLRTSIAFPWLSMTYTSISGLSMVFQVFHDPYKPWVLLVNLIDSSVWHLLIDFIVYANFHLHQGLTILPDYTSWTITTSRDHMSCFVVLGFFFYRCFFM